jgi:hypothetical protein
MNTVTEANIFLKIHNKPNEGMLCFCKRQTKAETQLLYAAV